MLSNGVHPGIWKGEGSTTVLTVVTKEVAVFQADITGVNMIRRNEWGKLSVGLFIGAGGSGLRRQPMSLQYSKDVPETACSTVTALP